MKNKALSAVVLCALIFALIPFHGAAAEQTVTHLAAAVSKNGSYIELNCTLSDADIQRLEGKKLSLYSVPVYEEKNGAGAVPITENITPASEMTLQAAYTGDLTCGYVLAADNGDGTENAVTNYAYVTNPDAFAQNSAEFFLPCTKKGLNFTAFADAQILGVGNTVIKVALNEFITDDPSALQCRSGSKYCFVDRDMLDSLDRKVKTYGDAGIRVFLEFVLTKRCDGQPGYLYFDSAGEAEYYAVNITEKRTADALYAFTSFIVNRYTSQQDNGFCASIILGYEVESNRNTNSAGPMSLYDYTEKYAAALRTADAAARSVYADSRIYVSLGNALNKTAFGEGADPALDYSVTEFLAQLSSRIYEEGDIPWRVEVHPHNIDSDPLFINKAGSEYTYEADRLTMDNINVLTSLLSRTAYLYDGKRRGVVINGIGFGSGGNTDAEQKAQAAAYCLAYYRAEANDQIEAFVYGVQCDDADDPVNPGLYSRKNGTNGDPEDRKQIYKVFRYIDSDSSRIIAEPYLSVFSVSSWGEIVSGYNGSSQMKTRILNGTGTSSGDGMNNIKAVRMTDFSSGTGGFHPTENAKVVSCDKDTEGRELYGGDNSVTAELLPADPHEYRGISAVFDGGTDISSNEFALIDVKVKSPENVKTTDIMLRLTGVSEDGVRTVYEGFAQISSDDYHRIYFNISEFSSSVGSVERVSVWVRPHGEKDTGEYLLTLNGISVFHKTVDTDGGGVLLPAIIIAGALILLFAAAYVIIFIRTRKQYNRSVSDENAGADRS